MIRYNIFDLKGFVSDPDMELFETIFTGNDCKVERIVSKGNSTPTGEWYDQEQDEWVILIQGNASIAFENEEVVNLDTGDYVFIPAHLRHRVVHTSSEPPCVWLAVHGNLKLKDIDG